MPVQQLQEYAVLGIAVLTLLMVMVFGFSYVFLTLLQRWEGIKAKREREAYEQRFRVARQAKIDKAAQEQKGLQDAMQKAVDKAREGEPMSATLLVDYPGGVAQVNGRPGPDISNNYGGDISINDEGSPQEMEQDHTLHEGPRWPLLDPHAIAQRHPMSPEELKWLIGPIGGRQ